MADEKAKPPPGWYPAHQKPGYEKYWDGTRWTDQVRAKKQGFWASLAPDPDVLATGLVDNQTTMKIYKNGTFTTKPVFGKDSHRDRLLGFEHDIDSMRRKSTTGRGAAAMLTGGVSLLASNNRGVVYVTVAGERTNVRTYTTRNPSGTTLTTIRSLKAAADNVISQTSASPAQQGGADHVSQLKQLAELHQAGALTDAEFAAAKARLLG
jgi:hypothetical protein